ncbi:bifunctional 4-hydroxy-2-oxoglutarate aldolase/2-dehydro-3-deoxy-phosphogluconate aldolase [Paracoccus marinaquae]|uniref:Bifunctional 4-hydroxy-2-oxoglutarate aldolase/2-dehydro-3-deoxy-phosphogluconate aldolase n=1 Tax=Paracoccus marinaquae TaxID=2841926 RepID=A0ABS6AJ83_9RHOB|nr:bifunctional 4-hydroxy-2-oxoglutarate aldolase/2-dehydro-3-deoxy-phosphogluconate aldolase [Paracoccus marinaquae]MBU3030659.1 bifunctional 4-hydroxy-2-oxoglutarate aldolase/2-dehydro-3-deoxy-phosphogluconate aldolase [Paracoccus marinaquae]
MTPAQQSQQTRALCNLAPVIPVIVIRDAARAADLARALVSGGLPVLEVTLRSDAALDAIRAMAGVEGGEVGAGTVLTPDDAKRAKDAGAKFAVSPGLTDRLIAACEDLALPLLPGTVTASEVMRAADAGFDMLKFFPAEAVGGAPALKSLAGPLPKISFCPTGGVSPGNAASYLSLPNVVCVGGSWIATDADVANGNWSAIEDRARTATALRQS